MICKFCHNEIADGSIFCNWCGERQAKARKKKDEIKVPKPRQLKSGMWNIELRAEGQSITEATAEKCTVKAKAIRAEFIAAKAKFPKLTLEQAMTKYVDAATASRSPATIRGYRTIIRCRFQGYMKKDVRSINWQEMVNEEMKMPLTGKRSNRKGELPSEKTVLNAWSLVSASLKFHHIPAPETMLPALPENELPWLSYKQIEIFLPAIRGTDCEMAALLALHSLRSSELFALHGSQIVNNVIHVKGARVRGEDGETDKKTNKNKTSTRNVHIFIPRLEQLLAAQSAGPDERLILQAPNTIRRHINEVCEKAGLPPVGLHGLRRSFASLAHHLGWDELETMRVGGWSRYETVHKFYIKLDQSDIQKGTSDMLTFYQEIEKKRNFTNEFTNDKKIS